MSEVSHGIKPSCAQRSQVYSRLSQLWTVHPRTLIDKKASCKAGLCYWGMIPMDIKNTLTTERPHKYLCYNGAFRRTFHGIQLWKIWLKYVCISNRSSLAFWATSLLWCTNLALSLCKILSPLKYKSHRTSNLGHSFKAQAISDRTLWATLGKHHLSPGRRTSEEPHKQVS